jgi:hypothetical protein
MKPATTRIGEGWVANDYHFYVEMKPATTRIGEGWVANDYHFYVEMKPATTRIGTTTANILLQTFVVCFFFFTILIRHDF